MKKKNDAKIAPGDAVRKEDLNRARGTVEFIDPERGPTNKGRKDNNQGKRK